MSSAIINMIWKPSLDYISFCVTLLIHIVPSWEQYKESIRHFKTMSHSIKLNPFLTFPPRQEISSFYACLDRGLE